MRVPKMRFSRPTGKCRRDDGRNAGARLRVGPASAHAIARVAVALLCLVASYVQQTFAQDIQSAEKAHAQVCPDPPPQTSGSHLFRRAGETIDIPITIADCQPVDLVLRWANGRNNGSLFSITFLDSNNQPIYTRGINGFLSGAVEIPLNTFEAQPWFAVRSVASVPTTVVIQAGQPFAYPANISYTVTRQAARVRSRHQASPPATVDRAALSKSDPVSIRVPVLDDQVAGKLRTADGRLVSQGQGLWTSGSADSVRYKLKELALTEPRDMETHGRRETVNVAYRLTLAGTEPGSSQNISPTQAPALSKFGLIWLNDAALPAFSLVTQEISALVFDPSVLKDGAEIAVSNADGSSLHRLAVRLTLPQKGQSPLSNVRFDNDSRAQTDKDSEAGNEVVAIRNSVRVIGSTRMPLVQVELKTNRPFPPRDSSLQMQIGKRFFVDELTGDHTGRRLTLTLTQEMFAELQPGAEIIAFFDKA